MTVIYPTRDAWDCIIKTKLQGIRQSQQTNLINESNETVILEVGKEFTYVLFISLFFFFG